MNIQARLQEALKRLASDEPMLKGSDKGTNTLEFKTRVLYAKRVLSTANKNTAIEKGVIAEMQAQSSIEPTVTETMLGEHPLPQGHQDKDENG